MIRTHRRRLQLRESDGTLTVFPDFSFPWNAIALGALAACLKGQKLSTLLGRFEGSPERQEAVTKPLRDLQCLLESPLPGAAHAVGARHMQYSRPRSPLPTACEINLTLSCPLRCRACGRVAACTRHPMKRQRDGRHLTARQWRTVFRKLKSEARLIGVTLTGGEPPEHGEFVRVVHNARDEGLEVHLVTSGDGLTEHSARKLVEMGVALVTLKLFAASPEILARWTGDAAHEGRVLHAVAGLREAGIVPRAYTILTRSTAPGFADVVPWCRKQGIRELWVELCPMEQPEERVPVDQLEEWVTRIAQYCADAGIRLLWSPRMPLCVADPLKCGAFVRHTDFYDGVMGVAPDGTAFTRGAEPLALGDLVGESVADVWSGPTVGRLLLLNAIPAPCRRCMYMARCFGGAQWLGPLIPAEMLQPIVRNGGRRGRPPL